MTPQECRTTLARYRITMGCLGSKYVRGIVDYQIGHNAKSRKSIVELKEDTENMHRVEYWDLMKGIEEPEKVNMPEDNDSDVPNDKYDWRKGFACASTPSSST